MTRRRQGAQLVSLVLPLYVGNCRRRLELFLGIDTYLTHHWNVEQSGRSNEEQRSTSTEGQCKSTVNIEEKELSPAKAHQTSVEVCELGSVAFHELFQVWCNETGWYYCAGVSWANKPCFRMCSMWEPFHAVEYLRWRTTPPTPDDCRWSSQCCRMSILSPTLSESLWLRVTFAERSWFEQIQIANEPFVIDTHQPLFAFDSFFCDASQVVLWRLLFDDWF